MCLLPFLCVWSCFGCFLDFNSVFVSFFFFLVGRFCASGLCGFGLSCCFCFDFVFRNGRGAVYTVVDVQPVSIRHCDSLCLLCV